MITINWTKYKTEYKSLEDRYSIVEGEIYTGLVNIEDKEQDLSILNNKNEHIIGRVESIPFVSFTIVKTESNNYGLITKSDISLRNYKPLQYKIEKWGEDEKIKPCMDRAMSIITGFKEYLGTGKENDGEYLKY
jgi:hypothetical protein